jgi:hypothetical protein
LRCASVRGFRGAIFFFWDGIKKLQPETFSGYLI